MYEGLRWTWDEPLQLLSVSTEADDAAQRVFLPVHSVAELMPRLAMLNAQEAALLERALRGAEAETRMWQGVPPWPVELRDPIGLLLMFLVATAGRRKGMRGIDEAARRVAALLPSDTPSGAWRVAFEQNLSSAHRAAALAAAAEVPLPIPELVWWTAKCRLDHASQWAADSVNGADAARELMAAVDAYIRLLRREPSRRAMENFFVALGTTSEDEIVRALGAREEVTSDEILHGDVMTWLLRRYALWKSWRLLRGSLRPAERIGAVIAGLMTIAGIAMFVLQNAPRAQVIIQISAFIALVFISPRIFALLLPRALFGTLLAWITVVIAQSATLLPILSTDQETHKACHLWLTQAFHPQWQVYDWAANFLLRGEMGSPPAAVDFVVLIFACLTISIIFVMVEVSSRLATRIFGRAVYCVAVMLAGSLFWGAMLVPTLQFIIGREAIGTRCTCTAPAWVLGSVCAVAFGILVQLMWDDHPISDAFGLPAERVRH